MPVPALTAVRCTFTSPTPAPVNIDLMLRIQAGDMSVLTDSGVVSLAVFRLVKLGLVEMVGDLPILTAAGVDLVGEDDF